MSTIPSIFNVHNRNETLPSYTAVGGSKRASSTGLSAVLLNRGGHYPRRTFFQELEKAGFDYILSIEGTQERYDLEELSGRFPFVRFILVKEKISPGEWINLAAKELTSPYFFALWNDQSLFNGINASKMMELFCGKRLCTVPAVQNSRFEILHTLNVPIYYQGKGKERMLKTLPEEPIREDQTTLFPYDWLGLYDRERFLQLGGFDREIFHPYWQLMDFGFRAYLWGEEIRSTKMIRIVYDGLTPPEDITVEDSYRLFYLKNLAPEWRSDHAYLPLRCFPSYLAKSGWDLPTAWAEFFRERKWIIQNGSCFCRDARGVIDLWEHNTSKEIAEPEQIVWQSQAEVNAVSKKRDPLETLSGIELTEAEESR